MKTSGICPKCESLEIYRIPHNYWNEADPRVQTGWTYLSSIPVTRYVCGRCGFSEEWIANEQDLRALISRLTGTEMPSERVMTGFEEVDPNRCPACGEAITAADAVCPSCGINFGLSSSELLEE